MAGVATVTSRPSDVPSILITFCVITPNMGSARALVSYTTKALIGSIDTDRGCASSSA